MFSTLIFPIATLVLIINVSIAVVTQKHTNAINAQANYCRTYVTHVSAIESRFTYKKNEPLIGMYIVIYQLIDTHALALDSCR